MEIRTFDDPGAFFAHAADFLEAREAQHNLLLGMRTRLTRDPHAYGPRDPFLATAESRGLIVGVGFRTPPHLFGLSTLDDPAAADAFAAAVEGEDLPGVFGPVAAAERFAGRWREMTGVEVRTAMAQGLYEATEVAAPTSVRGRMRDYDRSDRDVVAGWIDAFVDEAQPPGPGGDTYEFVDRRASEPDGGFVLWDDGGTPVSLAGFGSPTPTGIRVGMVFTPPERRGHGYASALTAALTARLLSGGRRSVFLFTDLANPTSNAIYRRIGYRHVDDITQLTFERS